MLNRDEIYNYIYSTQDALKNAADVIDTGGKLTANELRTLLKNQIDYFAIILLSLNESSYNQVSDLLQAENLFTKNLTLQEPRSHNLAGNEFHIGDQSPDNYMGINFTAQSLTFDVFKQDNTANSNVSIGLSEDMIYLNGKNEYYRNRTIRHSNYDGIELKSAAWVSLIKLSFSPAPSVIEIEYRISGYVYPKDQYYFKKETVVLSWDSENYRFIQWPNLPNHAVIESGFSSTNTPQNYVTVKSRTTSSDSGYFSIEVSTPDAPINTIWHYEILIRTL